ncbi:MAG: hypothetical protein QMD09_09320 [Desulfatibacillaceae bacterium]|nr:hypothetical protein [Desulfatibacillaceae bacterium]
MTKHIKNDDERQQRNANHSGNPGDRVVDKTTLIFMIILVSLLIGSFSVRELYKGNIIVDTMLSGINMVYFWFIMTIISELVYNYFTNNKSRNLTYVMKNLILYPFLLILGYALTIIYIKSLWSIIVWLPVITIIISEMIAKGSSSKTTN